MFEVCLVICEDHNCVFLQMIELLKEQVYHGKVVSVHVEDCDSTIPSVDLSHDLYNSQSQNRTHDHNQSQDRSHSRLHKHSEGHDTDMDASFYTTTCLRYSEVSLLTNVTNFFLSNQLTFDYHTIYQCIFSTTSSQYSNISEQLEQLQKQLTGHHIEQKTQLNESLEQVRQYILYFSVGQVILDSR